MKILRESEKMIRDYYEAEREAFIAKMKSEDDERSNLKFKLAAFVIHEISHATPLWFKSHFLTNIARNIIQRDVYSKVVIKAENKFYDAIADYLIKLESDVDYVKRTLTSVTEEHAKKEFWKPIVSDAFLIVGIYFTPSLCSGIIEPLDAIKRPMGRTAPPLASYQSHPLAENF